MKKRFFSFILAAAFVLLPVLSGVGTAVPAAAAEPVYLSRAEVIIPSVPKAGEHPTDEVEVSPGFLEGVRWIDMQEKRELTSSDVFVEGHVCSFSVYLSAPDGLAWSETSDGYPAVKVICQAGEILSEALSAMFNRNIDGSVTLLAVFTFTIGPADSGGEAEEQPSPSEPETPGEPSGETPAEPETPNIKTDGNTVTSVIVRGAKVPVADSRMQITGYDASPCTVRDAGWYNVTDNLPLETGEVFVEGKQYCVSLFLLPPDGMKWAPDADSEG